MCYRLNFIHCSQTANIDKKRMKTQRTTNQTVQQLFILCLFAYVSVFHYKQLILFMAITILTNRQLYKDTSRNSLNTMNAVHFVLKSVVAWMNKLNNSHKQFTSSLCMFIFFATKKVDFFFHGKTKLPNHQLYNKLYDRPSHCVEICCSMDQKVENTSQTDHKQ